MNCHRLLCVCNCGGYGHPHALWITDQKQLLVTAICVKCEERFNALFPLTDLFKGCPLPDVKELNEALGREIEQITTSKPLILTTDDKKFLDALKIKFIAP